MFCWFIIIVVGWIVLLILVICKLIIEMCFVGVYGKNGEYVMFRKLNLFFVCMD